MRVRIKIPVQCNNIIRFFVVNASFSDLLESTGEFNSRRYRTDSKAQNER